MDLPVRGREPGVEEALRDGRGDLRAFFEAVDDLIFVATPDSRLVYANPALSATLGYSAQDIAAMQILHLHPPEVRGEAEAIHAALLRGDRDDCPLPLQAASGALVPVETRLWLGQWNGAACVFGVSRDLTAEQGALQRFERAEEALAGSHDLLANLARLVPGAIYQYRLDPDGRSAFPYSSPGMSEIYEVTPEEVREDATPVFGRLHPDDAARVGELIAESARTLEEFYCQFRVILPRQGLRWRWSQAHPERTGDGGTLWHGVISDITERRLADEELRETRDLLELAQRASGAGSWDWDVISGRIDWSREMFALFGLDEATVEAGFDAWNGAMHPDDIEVANANVTRALAKHAALDSEYRIVKPDGEVRWINALGRGVYGEQGEPVRMSGMCIDITERRAVEEKLRESETRFRLLFESLTTGFALHEIVRDAAGTPCDYRFISVNPAFESLVGRSAGELVGRTVLEVLPGTEPAWIERYGRVATTGEPAEFEDYASALDRTYHVVAYSPEPEHFAVVVEDMTEHKRAEEALRASEERFQGVFDSTNDLISIVHPVRDERGAIVDLDVAWANATWRSWFGWTGRDPGTPRLLEIAPWLARMLPTYERVTATGQVERDDVQLPDGRWLDVEYVAFGDGLLVVSRDVTERNRLAAQVLQSQKMETVGRLAGGVAHDFNNLLTVVLGNVEIARADLDPADPRQDALTQIEDAGRRGAALARQLLAFSRQQFVSPEVLELSSVVAEMEGMLRRLIGEGITLTVIAGEPPGRVRADRAQVGQVLLNLVVNARDAMPDGGAIRIDTLPVELGEADTDRPTSLAPGPYVALVVADTGAGIDEATRAHLFEPFFTTKGPGAGSGLGLSTAQGIARQGRGDVVCVESAPGCGTSFALYLPATDEPLPAASAPTVVPAVAGTGTILLVEDDPGVRRLAERDLEGAGYVVLPASDGAEALRILASHPGSVELIVTDVIMPTMGGRELARHAAESRPRTRVLFTSGYPGDALAADGVLPRAAHFIGKPYTAAGLTAAVREVLGGGGEEQGRRPTT